MIVPLLELRQCMTYWSFSYEITCRVSAKQWFVYRIITFVCPIFTFSTCVKNVRWPLINSVQCIAVHVLFAVYTPGLHKNNKILFQFGSLS